jgi:hypothetical protein
MLALSTDKQQCIELSLQTIEFDNHQVSPKLLTIEPIMIPILRAFPPNLNRQCKRLT